MQRWFDECNSRELLAQFFLSDPVLFNYHLGDLDDFYFPHCTWQTAVDSDGNLKAVVLLYHPPTRSTPVVLALSKDEDEFGQLVAHLTKNRFFPETFWCHFSADFMEMVDPAYRLSINTPFPDVNFKMRLGPDGVDLCRQALKQKSFSGQLLRLTSSPDHLAAAMDLYRTVPSIHFDPRMLHTHFYYGVMEPSSTSTMPRLLCIAGVHVHSTEYKLAVIGSVATRPGFRGAGYATACVAMCVLQLIEEGGCRPDRIGLNVEETTAPARRIYDKLGFLPVHTILEGEFVAESLLLHVDEP
ncbi:uncharacterized protein SPPG_04521 [Spizellomyces punctatus DAOM BR117]|uniref:N-acetyltransferase domain-containing protein n=1 Tax=Spizellomyces punctatus (strain DAOM BR117) TaxID=645134 RepID=A0A0L0HH26_SPIPD|nr:uncharacterized protein SPPG_04521 [Spizellomyces punctatus DAOM BR117]KND00180.1 hypothetical protein SPPG_04521 [Spizellomyces punctatus DAOM BR117]|eukprot:XP_016608219.1 hypothetical protein SPPG_04521 [Spizellomyces punctatus DAOM BR117]